MHEDRRDPTARWLDQKTAVDRDGRRRGGILTSDALVAGSRVLASVSSPQTPLPSSSIPKYVTRLRTFDDLRAESSSFSTRMVEFQQLVLPPSMYPSSFKNGTWLWGYQINVSLPLSSQDFTYNPATGAPLRGGDDQPPAIVRLVSPATGTIAPGVQPAKKRQLVIFEQDTFAGVNSNPPSNGPLEDLLNNSRWKGLRDGTSIPIPGSVLDQQGQGIWQTELPRWARPSSGSCSTPHPTRTRSTSTSSSSRCSTGRASTSSTT